MFLAFFSQPSLLFWGRGWWLRSIRRRRGVTVVPGFLLGFLFESDDLHDSDASHEDQNLGFSSKLNQGLLLQVHYFARGELTSKKSIYTRGLTKPILANLKGLLHFERP